VGVVAAGVTKVRQVLNGSVYCSSTTSHQFAFFLSTLGTG
jgi:hypothetical protein